MTAPLHELLVSALRETLGGGSPPDSPLGLHEPELTSAERDAVVACLDAGWVSSAGPLVARFEEALAGLTGVKHALATVNGTAALHLALVVAGVKADDEVLLPTLTFVATANAVAYCRAVPHLVDSAPDTLGVDPAKLETHLNEVADVERGECHNRETGRRIKAIVPMHVFGHPVEMDELSRVANRFGITVIEDACESLGSTYRGRPTGGLGKIGVLSFNGNKIVTTGGGGALLTNDDDLAAKARHLGTTAKQPHPWAFDHDAVGFNYRLPSLNAALGIAQLARLDDMLTRKRKLAAAYREALREVPGIAFVTEPEHTRGNYWLNAIVLEEDRAGERDSLLGHLHDAGFHCRPVWTPMHRLPMFEDCPRMELSTADALSRRLINLPSSAILAGLPAGASHA